MDIILANPWGLAALASLPALVVIHALRQRSRRVLTSTLFLLEHAGPEPVGGWRLDAFRQAFPFWMQVLACLALTWLLVEPRFIRADSRQIVAVVLDSSASMTPFRTESIAALSRHLRRIAAVAGRTEWHLLETGPRRPPLHTGERLDDLLRALEDWKPTLGIHDFSDAVALATSLAPADRGAVILVTDRPVTVPAGVAILSVGSAIDNAGISGADCSTDEPNADGAASEPGGVSPSGLRWRALVTNHGTTPVERRLALRHGTAASLSAPSAVDPRSIRLEPGQSRTVAGPWPAGAERLILELTPDRFPFDDRVALVRPVPRTVRVAIRPETQGGELLGKMLAAATDTDRVDSVDDADLVVEPFGTAGTKAAVQVRRASTEGSSDTTDAEEGPGEGRSEGETPGRIDPTALFAEAHPLVRDLTWRGLLSGPAGGLPIGAGDEPLVWKGSDPFIRVRTEILADGGLRETLILDFDVDSSTASRTPALVVLLDRWVDRVREQGARPWAATFQTGESIALPATDAMMTFEALPDGADSAPTALSMPFRGRAPVEAGFFTVLAAKGDGPPLLSGAVQQGDGRESDFSAAAPLDTVEELRLERIRRQSVEDPFLPGWLALVAAALLAAWAWQATRPPLHTGRA